MRSWWWCRSNVSLWIFYSVKCFTYCSDSSLCYFCYRVSGLEMFYESLIFSNLSQVFVKNLLSVFRLLFSNLTLVFSSFNSFISYSICFNFFSFSSTCDFSFFCYCLWRAISSMFFYILSYPTLSLFFNSFTLFISCSFSFWATNICFWCSNYIYFALSSRVSLSSVKFFNRVETASYFYYFF